MRTKLALTLLLFSVNLYADHLSLKIDRHNAASLFNRDDVEFSLLKSVTTDAFSLTIKVDGEEPKTFTKNLEPLENRVSNFVMMIYDKDLVKITDEGNELKTLLPAKIRVDKTLPDKKITGISITSDNMKTTYSKIMVQSGFQLLEKLNINTQGQKINSNVEMSDFDCNTKEGELLCDQRITVEITAET